MMVSKITHMKQKRRLGHTLINIDLLGVMIFTKFICWIKVVGYIWEIRQNKMLLNSDNF